jgi:hypothetical protein
MIEEWYVNVSSTYGNLVTTHKVFFLKAMLAHSWMLAPPSTEEAPTFRFHIVPS